MTFSSPSTDNPYRPPQQRSEYQGLAPDTEFLISGNCILCGPVVELPPVCIQSGDMQGVVRRHGTQVWTPRWLRIATAVAVFMAVYTGIQYAFGAIFVFGPMSVNGLALTTRLLIVLAAASLAALVLAFAWHRRQRVTIVWYLSEGLHENESRLYRIRTVGQMVAAVSAGITVILGFTVAAQAFVALAWIVLAVSLLRAQTRPRYRPTVIGVHGGLLVLNGFSLRFIHKLHDMMKKYAERDRPTS